MLIIFLSTLVFMLLITQQYDAYQSTVAAMQQRQIDMYSENLLAAYPGVINGTGTLVGGNFQVSCAGGSQCNNYTVIVNNPGIAAQVVRLYIFQAGSSCAPCIINPANATSPVAANRFRVPKNQIGDTVNSGESQHYMVFWLPSGTSLSGCGTSPGCKLSIATARGRVFSFLYPFPPSPLGSGGQSGGTGLYIGPLLITFQKELIEYTNNQVTTPPVPIGGDNGYWTLTPGGGNTIILYVKVQTDVNVTNDVYLTPQSVFELVRFDNPGVVNFFYAIAPITPTFCNTFKVAPGAGHPNGYNQDLNCNGVPYLAGGNTGNIGNIVSYNACGQPPSTYDPAHCTGRYIIPKPTAQQLAAKQKGTPVIVAFAVSTVSGGTNKLQTIQNSWSGKSVTTFLGLSYVYNDGSGSYLYGVTLPFISACINNCAT